MVRAFGIYGRTETVEDCISCGEGLPESECSNSEKVCKHHCNHSWTHDACCYCNAEFGEEN